jgi:uncharacterized protein (TIGR03067 family)
MKYYVLFGVCVITLLGPDALGQTSENSSWFDLDGRWQVIEMHVKGAKQPKEANAEFIVEIKEGEFRYVHTDGVVDRYDLWAHKANRFVQLELRDSSLGTTRAIARRDGTKLTVAIGRRNVAKGPSSLEPRDCDLMYSMSLEQSK